MGSTLSEVIPLALGAAVSPAVIGALVLALISGRHRLAKGVGLLIGSSIPLILISILILVFWDGTTSGHDSGAIGAWIDIVLGAVLILGGALVVVVKWRAKRAKVTASWQPVAHGGPSVGPTPEREANEAIPVGPVVAKVVAEHRIDPDLGTWRSAKDAFVTGLGMMAANLTTLAMFVPAMKDIASASLPGGQSFLVAMIAIVITQSPVIVIVALYGILRTKADRFLEPVGRWMAKNGRTVALVIAVVVGIYLLFKGLRGI